MGERERLIEDYFAMWLQQDGSRLGEVFAPDVVYSECYGPEYRGLGQIRQWFADWNRSGRVTRWECKEFLHQGDRTAVEWYFQCRVEGEIIGFDGVSIISFAPDGKVRSLKEFESKAEHRFPYGQGERE